MAGICPTFPRVGHVESANFLRQSTDVFQVSTQLGVAIYCFMFPLLYVGLLVCMSVSLSVWQFVRLSSALPTCPFHVHVCTCLPGNSPCPVTYHRLLSHLIPLWSSMSMSCRLCRCWVEICYTNVCCVISVMQRICIIVIAVLFIPFLSFRTMYFCYDQHVYAVCLLLPLCGVVSGEQNIGQLRSTHSSPKSSVRLLHDGQHQ